MIHEKCCDEEYFECVEKGREYNPSEWIRWQAICEQLYCDLKCLEEEEYREYRELEAELYGEEE